MFKQSNSLKEIIEAEKKHHITCYGTEAFTFEMGRVTHPGVWAFGGTGNEPCLYEVGLRAPSKNDTEAWLCYIGPLPKFTNGTE